MSITVSSTTDTPEAITAAQGGKPQEKVAETKSASEVTPPEETKEASEASQESESETEEKAKEGEEKEDKPKKKGGFKKRIDKLNTKLSKAESEALYWRNEAMKTQKPAAEESPKKVEVKSADGKPKSDDFESHEEYVEALADWKVEQKLSARDQKSKESEIKSDYDKRVSTHVERVQKFSKDHEDFNELIESIDDVPMPTIVQQCILDSENGPELMYELAKDRKEYERICNLPAHAAARAIGLFEAKLAKPSTDAKVATTKTPKPITPVGSKGSGLSTKSPDEMDFQEFKKWREQQT